MRSRPRRLVLLPGALLLLTSCPGDLQPDLPPDKGYSPLPDFGARPEAGADGRPAPDGPLADGPRPDVKQGMSCSDQGISFKVVSALAPSAKVRVDVTAAKSYSWVMVGITSSKGTTRWTGGVINVSCSGGTCSWTFPKAAVPGEPGPYSLSLMRDATNDNPSRGVIEATCTP